MRTESSKYAGNRLVWILLLAVFVFGLLDFSPLGTVAHAYDDEFEYTVAEGSVTITGYTGSASAVVIPDELDGYAVTAIGGASFKDNHGLLEVTLADSLTAIGTEAFSGTGLTALIIPAGVTDIGDSAFSGCSQLRGVCFEGDAPQMGSDVFKDADGAFLICFYDDNTGWSQPQWEGYPSMMIPAELDEASISSAAALGPESIRIIWDAVPYATAYEIYSAVSPSGDYTLIKATASTSFTHSKLDPNTIYYYKVRACFDAGFEKIYGAYSAEKWARTALAVPQLTVSSPSYNSNRLSWNAVPNVDGFEIYRATSSSGAYTMIAKLTNGTAVSHTDPGLVAGNAYHYKMRAYAIVDGATVYSDFSVSRSATVLPAQPTLSAASASYRSIRLRWDKVAGASGYELHRATSPTGTYKRIKTTKATAFTNGSLKTGTSYYYKVRAYRTVNRKKVYSAFSPVMSAAPTLPTPAKISAAASGHSASRITWGRVTPASGYEIYRATSPDGTYTRIHTAKSSRTLSLTNRNLKTGVTYYYKVRAYRRIGSSTAYSGFTPVSSAQPLPAKTAGVTYLKPSQTSVRMTWAAAAGASGYEVFEATSSSGDYTLAGTTTSRSFTKSGLDAEETYLYKVRAFSQAGGSKVYGPFSDTAPARASLTSLNKELKKYGKFTIAGMKPDDYRKAVSTQWSLVNTTGTPAEYAINLETPMNYNALQEYILNLGKYEGVDVFIIGKSEQNRHIYMIRLDLGDPAQNKPLIMITGGVHAREFGGTDYAVKFLNDTLIKAQSDAETRALLEKAVIVVVPLVNPDGRELIIRGGNASRKSNANGVDLNRNMPSVNAGQHAKGAKKVSKSSSKPGRAYFAGYSLGSEKETQALIKWFNHYVPKANVFIDLHQQGGMTFYNKGFVSKEIDAQSKSYAQKNNALLKNGYPLRTEIGNYGLNGSGSTFTDYAESVAEGFVFSFKFGRMVLLMDGKETPLLRFKDIDNHRAHYKPVNTSFKSITVEIGRSSSTGAGATARQRRRIEYEKYGWEDFLTGTIKIVLGQ